MIIKIDVNNNDYAERISEILDKKVNGLWQIYDDYFNDLLEKCQGNDYDSLLKYREISIKKDDIKEWIFNDKIPEEKVKEASDIIKECVLHLLYNSYSDESLDYLRKEIVITFPKDMNAKWENGEAIFYFPNTYSKHKFLLF